MRPGKNKESLPGHLALTNSSRTTAHLLSLIKVGVSFPSEKFRRLLRQELDIAPVSRMPSFPEPVYSFSTLESTRRRPLSIRIAQIQCLDRRVGKRLAGPIPRYRTFGQPFAAVRNRFYTPFRGLCRIFRLSLREETLQLILYVRIHRINKADIISFSLHQPIFPKS